MTIRGIGSELARLAGTKGSPGEERSDDAKTASSDAKKPTSDSVEVSAEGRALAAQADQARSTLSPERHREIGARLMAGVYDDPAMAEEVARRLVSSGDLD